MASIKLLTKVANTFDKTNRYLAILASGILACVVLVVTVDVAMRYLLNRPIEGAFEITEHMLLFITFLSATWLLKEDAHVKLDIVLNRLNPASQSLLNFVTSILATVVCLTLAWYSAKVTWGFFQSGIPFPTEIRIPRGPVVIIIPIGFSLLFIQFLRRACGYLGIWRASQAQK